MTDETTGQFYVKLQHSPIALIDAINKIEKQNQKWTEHFGFNAIELDSSLIQTDHALKAVHSVQSIARLGLLMVPSSTFYKWHKDAFRQCCLNMLISRDHHSHTLFSKHTHGQNMDVVELKYEPDTLYLFNNQAEHCVLNLDGPRFLFSLYFCNETPYESVKKKLASAGLLAGI